MVNVAEKVREVLLGILDIQEEDIVPTATFTKDLHATSLDLIDILTALENTFDVSIPEAVVMEIKTVQDAIDFLQAAITRPLSPPGRGD